MWTRLPAKCLGFIRANYLYFNTYPAIDTIPHFLIEGNGILCISFREVILPISRFDIVCRLQRQLGLAVFRVSYFVSYFECLLLCVRHLAMSKRWPLPLTWLNGPCGAHVGCPCWVPMLGAHVRCPCWVTNRSGNTRLISVMVWYEGYLFWLILQ